MRSGVVLRATAATRSFALSGWPLVSTSTPALNVSSRASPPVATVRVGSLRSDRPGRLPMTKAGARRLLSSAARPSFALGGVAASSGAASSLAPADPESAPPGATVKPAATRVQMTIDALMSYELIEPIPVVIECPPGGKEFLAQAPDLEISVTGSSIGGAFLTLKEKIAATYEESRGRSGIEPARQRQLKLFQTYIGRSKRAWYLGR